VLHVFSLGFTWSLNVIQSNVGTSIQFKLQVAHRFLCAAIARHDGRMFICDVFVYGVETESPSGPTAHKQRDHVLGGFKNRGSQHP
jgi:hypothetical protein